MVCPKRRVSAVLQDVLRSETDLSEFDCGKPIVAVHVLDRPTVHDHLPELRAGEAGDYAYRCMPVFLRVQWPPPLPRGLKLAQMHDRVLREVLFQLTAKP
jgi:hypothetical protein